MKSLNMQLKEVPNKIFLLELQNRLRENKITEKQLARILSEFTFTHNERELSAAYEEWANDPEEKSEIKNWKTVERDGWDS